MNDIIRIGTRKSALALIQTQLVADELRQVCPGIQVEIVTKDTLGDRILDKPLQEFGGKGVFVSEFEQAIQEGVIDLAVHSAKDLPMELAEGLTIAAVSGREDPRDVLVTMRGHEIQPESMVRIGTSSPRRQLQAGLMRKTLWPGAAGTECSTLRGNVHTRLRKLEEGNFDCIILAAAGLKRLGLLEQDTYEYTFLNPEEFIPAGGQGLMAVEAKAGTMAHSLTQAMDHAHGRLCLELERRVLKLLGAGCHEPIGIYSVPDNGQLEVWGISSRRGEVKRIHLTGGTSRKDMEKLALEAWKGLM